MKISPTLFPFLALVPSLFFGWHVHSQMEELHYFSEKVHILHTKSLTLNEHVSPTKSDPLYLEKHLESLIFPSGSKLLFAEENLKRVGNKQEVIERQKHPIEIDEHSLKRLLSTIEGIPIDSHFPPPQRPELLFQHFELTKKNTPTGENIFLLNMQLIKRELL